MRILIVTTQLPTSDKPGTMAPLVRQIQSLRELDGVEVKVIEVKGYPKLKYLQTWSQIRKVAPHFDIIHAHYGFCGLLARFQFSRPLVVSYMGTDLLGTPNARGKIDWRRRLEARVSKRLARVLDSIIVKSQEMADVLSPLKVSVVPNGVDLDMFRPISPQEAKAFLGWPADKRYILFPGNPGNPRKGYKLAKPTVEKAAKIIGEPLELVALKDVSADRVPYYMNACEAMLMVSYIEGSPNVVKEALGCNTPIVSVPVGDVVQLLEGVEGSTICPRDTDLLANALVNTLRQDRLPTGRAAIIEKGLDLPSVANQLLRIYSDVLDTKKNKSGQSLTKRDIEMTPQQSA